jgi:hypothetical protein
MAFSCVVRLCATSVDVATLVYSCAQQAKVLSDSGLCSRQVREVVEYVLQLQLAMGQSSDSRHMHELHVKHSCCQLHVQQCSALVLQLCAWDASHMGSA